MGLFIGVIAGICFTVLFMEWRHEKARKKLVLQEQVFKLAEKARDIIYYCEVKPELKYHYISPALDYFLGEGSVAEAYQNAYSAFDRIHPHDYEILSNKVEGSIDYIKPIMQRWRDSSGNYKWFEEYTLPIYEKGELKALQGIIRNVDARREVENHLIQRIYQDGLTGVFNRVYFEEQIEKYGKYQDVPLSLILLDLDDLKVWNDQYGHAAGDKLLKKTAKALKSFENSTMSISRIGGDEFVILAENTGRQEAEKLLAGIQEKLKEDGSHIAFSAGIASCCSSKGEMERLFEKADKNMYENKRSKKNGMKL
ncbi:sensor domain-containing diguanylate cyclase [Metabacillus sp. GX 13764]|uniref:sensor domain-containing diguanylate cyclase n=1 Tax=Metabacillus kandeliae TaxID=2900151 RepID=UPI001E405888|nr:sensor domain-containing diguanylate cyclase [Metabacillus kandeliae]MCD7036359.1 sensor domain-containing diguanylate cyclase [Metabacillus kandeliae]